MTHPWLPAGGVPTMPSLWNRLEMVAGHDLAGLVTEQSEKKEGWTAADPCGADSCPQSNL